MDFNVVGMTIIIERVDGAKTLNESACSFREQMEG